MLGHNSFEPALETSLEQLDPVLVDVLGHEHVAARLDRLGQAGPAPEHRLPHQRPTLEVERVECEIRGRYLVAHARPAGQALSQTRVIGATVRVGRHQLAVDHAARRHPLRRRDDLGYVGGQVGEPAVLQADAAVRVAEEDAAKGIPLDLEDVLGRAEWRLRRRCLHRPHLVGEALQLDLQLVVHLPQIRPPDVRKLYAVSWCPRPASSARRAASWPAPRTGAGPPSGP